MQPLVHFRRANTGLTRHGFAATMPTSGACAWLSPEGRVGVLVLIAGRMCARSRLRSHHPPPRLATSPATVEPNTRMVHLPLRSWSSSSAAPAPWGSASLAPSGLVGMPTPHPDLVRGSCGVLARRCAVGRFHQLARDGLDRPLLRCRQSRISCFGRAVAVLRCAIIAVKA